MRDKHKKHLQSQVLFYISNELFSRSVARQVSSPQQSLTSVFGMGTGGPSAIISLIVLLTSKRNSRIEIETETQTI